MSTSLVPYYEIQSFAKLNIMTIFYITFSVDGTRVKIKDKGKDVCSLILITAVARQLFLIAMK